jgi:hypothetical protein
MWEKRNAHRVLVEMPEGKKPLETQGKDEGILQWILKEVGWESVDRIHLRYVLFVV